MNLANFFNKNWSLIQNMGAGLWVGTSIGFLFCSFFSLDLFYLIAGIFFLIGGILSIKNLAWDFEDVTGKKN